MAVITVSRQEGSGGDVVGKLVAERLDYAIVDRNVLVEAARQAGARIKALVPEIDEKKPSFWERLDEERRRYNLLLRYLVYDFAERDRCVIIGHGAQSLLGGLNHVLRVKVIAPMEVRVKRIMETKNLSKEAAIAAVRQRDHDHAGYVKYLFNEDWLNPHLCDLVLNNEKLSLEMMADLIVTIAQSDSSVPNATSKQILSDRALASRVEIRLLLDPRIGATNLRVVVNRGEVVVSGTLSTDEEKEIAEAVASNTPGVTRLVSELVVVPLTATLYP